MGRSRNRKKDQKFEYTPLKPGCIRVLQLQPGSRSDRLCGYFKVISLDDEAFSRTCSPYDLRWGGDCSLDFLENPNLFLTTSPNQSSSTLYLICGGIPLHLTQYGSQVLPIALKLTIALRYFRYTERPLSIWCDAICVNQNDLDERAQQVQLMRRIYSQADCVRIWINEPAMDGKNAAVSALQDYYKAPDSPLEGLGSDLGFWDPVVPIFQNSYWSRLWIQQEVLNARKIELHCMSVVIPGQSLAKFQKACFDYRQMTLTWKSNSKMSLEWHKQINKLLKYSSPAAAHISDHMGGTKFWTLLQMIETCQELAMTDRKDRVYATMHLAKDYEDGGIVVDYSKSEVEIMIDAIEYHIRRNYTLEFLNRSFLGLENTSTFSEREQRHVPTWLPQSWLDTEQNIDSLYHSSPGAMYTRSPSCFVQGKQLRVRGWKADQTKQCLIGANNYFDVRLKDFRDSPFGIFLQDSARVSIKAPSYELHNILTHGPAHDIRPTYDAVVSGIHFLLELARDVHYAERKIGYRANKIQDLLEGVDYAVKCALELIFDALDGRIVTMTENKCLGLLPECDVTEGDEVWILLGCEYPVILRPKNGVYWHVCTVYMPRLLQHPAIKGLSSKLEPGDKVGEWTVTDIVLE